MRLSMDGKGMVHRRGAETQRSREQESQKRAIAFCRLWIVPQVGAQRKQRAQSKTQSKTGIRRLMRGWWLLLAGGAPGGAFCGKRMIHRGGAETQRKTRTKKKAAIAANPGARCTSALSASSARQPPERSKARKIRWPPLCLCASLRLCASAVNTAFRHLI
jgi:hypothetical protein